MLGMPAKNKHRDDGNARKLRSRGVTCCTKIKVGVTRIHENQGRVTGLINRIWDLENRKHIRLHFV